MENSYQSAITEAKENSKFFDKHTLKLEAEAGIFRSWLCINPESSNYWFRIISSPRALIMLGDIGELIFNISDQDPIPWLRGATKSPHYMWSKTPQEFREESFYSDDARKIIMNLKEEGILSEEDVDEIEECFINGNSEAFCEFLYERTNDPDAYGSAFNIPYSFLFKLHALEKFLSLLDTK